MPEEKDSHVTIIAMVAIVGIVGIVLGMYGINKSSAGFLIPSTEEGLSEEDLVGGAVKDCIDSDSGYNYFVKGETCVGKGKNCESDKCDEDDLIEYACHKKRGRISTRYECQNGCVDGACGVLPKS